MKSFKDQVAVITGAASGLGLAIANRLSSEDVKLALIDLKAVTVCFRGQFIVRVRGDGKNYH